MNPRHAPLFLCAALLSATSGAQVPAPANTPAAASEFTTCLNTLRAPARAVGVSDATFTQHTQGLQPDMSVIDKLNFQPEFKTAIWDYLAALVDEERVADALTRAKLVFSRTGSNLLFDPFEIRSQTGTAYKVFTPFHRALLAAAVVPPSAPAPAAVRTPPEPASEDIDAWGLHPTRPDWSRGFDWTPGEAGLGVTGG